MITSDQLKEWKKICENISSNKDYSAGYLTGYDHFTNAAITAMPALIDECERLRRILDFYVKRQERINKIKEKANDDFKKMLGGTR